MLKYFFARGFHGSCCGVAIGGGMAACGVVLQALLGNPLACPQMLGVSGGASLGGILGLIFFPIGSFLSPEDFW